MKTAVSAFFQKEAKTAVLQTKKTTTAKGQPPKNRNRFQAKKPLFLSLSLSLSSFLFFYLFFDVSLLPILISYGSNRAQKNIYDIIYEKISSVIN